MLEDYDRERTAVLLNGDSWRARCVRASIGTRLLEILAEWSVRKDEVPTPRASMRSLA
jgi:hypothetical protein